jgi:hypothetical protein
MSEQDRIKAAEKAAADYLPVMMNQDPGMLRFARRCYAQGYADALIDQEEGFICEHGVPDGDWCQECNRATKQALIDNEWPVAPC